MKKLITRKTNYSLTNPSQMMKLAKIVKDYIVKNKLYVEIAGKNYVLVEGWQFAGGMLGLFPRVKEVEEMAKGKWKAQVEIIDIRINEVISTGFALCSKEESKKKTFDEYAILSMAQTRAIGKAYRNLIGWIMKLAGYEGTPAEEMKKQPEKKVSTAEEMKGVSSKKLEELKKMLKGKTTKDKMAYLYKKTGIRITSFNITEKHATRLIGDLLNNSVKR